MGELRKALEKFKEDKKCKDVLTVTSLYKEGKRITSAHNYRGTGDLKFDGTVDPVEYVSWFKTEMEVYQIKDLTKCHLLVATLREGVHQWFKGLPTNSVKSWK